jgi:hypothetical protein
MVGYLYSVAVLGKLFLEDLLIDEIVLARLTRRNR